MEKKNLWEVYTEEQLQELESVTTQYKNFLDIGKTERECVSETIKMARENGYCDLKDVLAENNTLKAGDKVYAVCMDKSIVLFHIGKEPMENGMNILGAHVDSPRIDVKQNPLYESGELSYLRPDGKTQVTIEYDNDGKPKRLDAVVVSTQHSADIDLDTLRKDVLEKVIKPIIPAELMDDETNIFINPTGRFVIGGPQGDTGLTGRKIIVDTYGGAARHGGGAFSGKDPTKVDRSAAYAARYVAKNIVAAGLASKCEVQLAYAIGVAKPVSIMVDTFGTGKCDDVRPSSCRNY